MRTMMKYRWKVIVSLNQYLNGVKRYWLILSICSLVTIVLEFYIPNLYKIFIDDIILEMEIHKLRIVIEGYLLAFAINYFVEYIQTCSKCKLVNTVLFRIRKTILAFYYSFSFTEYEKINIGDLKMRLDDDTEKLKGFAHEQTSGYLVEWIKMLVSIVLLLQTNWIITVFTITAVPFTFLINNLLSKKEKDVLEIRRKNLQNLTAWQYTLIKNWREGKALDLARHELRSFCKFWHKEMLIYAKWINYWTARVLIIPKVKNDFFMQVVLYLVGGILVINNLMTIGELLIFAVYYSIFYNAAQNVSSFDADLQSKIPYIDRLMDCMNQSTQSRQEGIIPGESYAIELQSVSFSYDKTKEVLNDFSIIIPQGTRVAIVGKSGSGKTTLLKLITGMLTPTSGAVFFSGINLNNINLDYMYRRIGFVMQENILFHTSIRENLLFGKSDATENEMEEACRKACIYEFISELPDGFDTVIGERGMKLSGGQRQSIILARLFLRDVDIFIFDEATSALDQYSERIVHDAILNISKDKTIIIVSHRESSIKLCDKVITVG